MFFLPGFDYSEKYTLTCTFLDKRLSFIYNKKNRDIIIIVCNIIYKGDKLVYSHEIL